MTPSVAGNDLKFPSHVSFGSVRSWGRARHLLQITTTWAPSVCFSDMMRWNTLSGRLMKNNECFLFLLLDSRPHSEQPCTSQRDGTVGEKCDLALGSGMFLLRLRLSVGGRRAAGGPGRGHMKGCLCQAATMFARRLMKTRTHEADLRSCVPATLHKRRGHAAAVDRL